MKRFQPIVLAAMLVAAAAPVRATWSIVICDSLTKEVAIGSATCIEGLNLKRYLPVVRVDVGAGAAQSFIDSTGTNRNLIWNELAAGTDPEVILAMLAAQDGGHQTRQYGIVDTRGRAVTFTGTGDGAYASGVVGRIGTLTYAIQGNVITGQPVIDAAEQAVRLTGGGVPEKLMAAMEAARLMGGDGRCSCSNNDPPGCGSPPPSFDKSAHIGFMVIARRGDEELGNCVNGNGCARGRYYFDENVIGGRNDPDPVFTLQAAFDAWRSGLVGVPDQVESSILLSRPSALNTGGEEVTLTIEIVDWQRSPATDITLVEVLHDPRGSAGATSLGDVETVGPGVYRVTATAGTTPGVDHIAVRVTSAAAGERYLMPSATLVVSDQRADLNRDLVVNGVDLSILLGSFGAGAAGDVDLDGDTDLSDLAIMFSSLPAVQ